MFCFVKSHKKIDLIFSLPRYMVIDKVLSFWFGSIKLQNTIPPVPIQQSFYKLWFNGGVEVDLAIKDKFLGDIERIGSNSQIQNEMMASIEGAMTLIILFDQFTRNVFRNTPDSFSYDPIALKCAQIIRENKWDLEMNPVYRGFSYLVLILPPRARFFHFYFFLFFNSHSNTPKI